jgi:hypothetical protein
MDTVKINPATLIIGWRDKFTIRLTSAHTS